MYEQQLDYDSRVVQRRLYQEALLEITLPALARRMDSKWRTVGPKYHFSPSNRLISATLIHRYLNCVFCLQELQQFEQYIFSDYSSFILVQNVYDDVLRTILSTEIETGELDWARSKQKTTCATSTVQFMLRLQPESQAPSLSACFIFTSYKLNLFKLTFKMASLYMLFQNPDNFVTHIIIF